MCRLCRFVIQVYTRHGDGLLHPSSRHPVIYVRYFSSPIPSPFAIPALAPLPPRPWYVIFPSLCPCVLIVQHPLMSENVWCLVFSLLRMMVSRFIHFPAKDMNSSFYGCIIFHGVYVPYFLYLVYHSWAFGLVPSFCYCKQCHNKHTCAYVFIIEKFIIFGYIPSNGITGSNSISISRSLRNRHTVFYNG